ncbi:hypothetical protein F5879DRAFT_996676 [Lentinula edodes]|nr:hypothetical protein F5879DRAFT_996676 [Lentinula edodes]
MTEEDPPLGHLALFKSVFSVGVSLVQYIVDDPLWPVLAATGLPGSFCLVAVTATTKPCILGQLAQFCYFAHKCSRNLAFAHRFLEVHRDPGQRTQFSLLPEQWRTIADRIESSTSSNWALFKSSPLDNQNQLEEDCLELGDFLHCQPKLSTVAEPLPSGPRSQPVPDKALFVPRKRKWAVRIGEASSSKHKCSMEHDQEVDKALDYHCVVLVFHPQFTGHQDVVDVMPWLQPD